MAQQVNQNRDLLLESMLSGITNGIFVEIGTYRGHFVDKVLSINKDAKMFCIDPYESYDEYNDSINTRISGLDYNETYSYLKGKYGDRIQLIRLSSADAIGMIPEQIDFLHIDGNHCYNFVKRDLELYFPKVKSNGFIMGSGACDHDESKRDNQGNVFVKHSKENYSNYGVVKAFSDFLTANNLTGAGSNDRIFFKKTTHKTVAPVPKNELCFVTRFKTDGLSADECIQQLFNIISFQYKLVVFVEPTIHKSVSKYKFENNIVFIDSEDVQDTFVSKYMIMEREILLSNIYEKSRSNCKANHTPEHTLGGHSKINFIRYAKSLNPDYLLYMWIDADCVTAQTNTGKIQADKITFGSLKDMPMERLGPEHTFASDDIYVNCGSFVVPNSLVETFELLYEYKLLEWQTRWIADDEQSLVFQMIQDCPDLFNIVKYPFH